MGEIEAESVNDRGPLVHPRKPDTALRRTTVDITGSAVAKVVVGLLVLGLADSLFVRMRDIFVWTLTAAFLAIALNPLVERLEPRFGRKPAATIVTIGSLVGFVAVLAALIAPFVSQVDPLSTAVPKAIADAQRNSTIKDLDTRFHLAQHAKEHLDSLPNFVFGAAATILGGAVAIPTTFFLTLSLY